MNTNQQKTIALYITLAWITQKKRDTVKQYFNKQHWNAQNPEHFHEYLKKFYNPPKKCSVKNAKKKDEVTIPPPPPIPIDSSVNSVSKKISIQALKLRIIAKNAQIDTSSVNDAENLTE